MNIGEIKAEALMIMGVNNGNNIDWSDIQGLKNNPTYSTYIFAMNGAINRCLKRLYTAGALEREPSKILPSYPESDALESFASDISATLADMIPLYVVGDVFALDEPDVAQNKRNEFEALLEEYMNKRAFVEQTEIDVMYEGNV